MTRSLHPSARGKDVSFRAPRGQRGETLLELMVATLIMGTAIVAILGAMITTIRTSAQHRDSVKASTAATTIAELIQNAPYVNCATSYASAYAPPGYVKPTNYTVDVGIKYLVSKTTATPAYQTTCTTDQGMQEITVTVTSTQAGKMSEKVVLGKRKS